MNEKNGDDKLKQTKIKYFSSSKDSIQSEKEGRVGENTTHEGNKWFTFKICKGKRTRDCIPKRRGRTHQMAKKPRKRCSRFSFWSGGSIL